MVPFQSEKSHNSSTKKVPFQKSVKIPQQKCTISCRKGSKFLNKNSTISEKSKVSKLIDKDDTISEKGQNPRQQLWYHFSQKRVIIPRQKKEPFQKRIKILQRNGKISEESQKWSKKWYNFGKRSKIVNKIWNRFRKWRKFQ